MKKTILSISVFLIIGIAQAQFYANWTEPVAITDSLSINSNPVVLTAENTGNAVFCFYEKKVSENSPSQIYYRNIYTMTDEQAILSDDVFDFRNPKTLFFSQNNEARYFLVFESNESGNFDLYGIEFFVEGTFGLPFKLTNTPGNENSSMLYNGYDYNTACWKLEEGILTSQIVIVGDSLQFEEVFTIDTSNCYEPVCSGNFVFYTKIINDSSHVYFSEFNEAENFWMEPDTIYATGNNINLTTGKLFIYSFNNTVYVCWENNNQLLCWESIYHQISISEFEGITESNEPDFLTFEIFVDYFDFPAVFTFCSGEGQNKDVYSYSDYSFYGQNISNNNVEDSDPKVFYGPFYSNYFNTINIWQSNINDNMVLYMSQISILVGSTSENNGKNNKLLKTSPNPFKNELKIEYYLSTNDEASIDIYSVAGKQIEHIDLSGQKDGWDSYIWNPNKTNQTELPEGAYFILLKQSNETEMQKVIYSK